MSKILNVRLPNAAPSDYSPQQFDQLVRSLEQIVFQLNNTYTPQVTENNQSELDWFTGHMGPVSRSTLEDRGVFAHGMFYDTTDQTQTVINTAKAITFNSTAYSKHISVDSVDTSKIVFAKAGRYKLEFTAQLNSESANAKTFWFWPRINGTDVAGSTMRITVHDNGEAKTVARAGLFQVNAGDYLQAMWAVDSLDTSLQAYAAETFCPAVPSVTLICQSISHEQ
jgi:FlaG/FlaF family flagellin (archaellin)